jgi:hypothetical protein
MSKKTTSWKPEVYVPIRQAREFIDLALEEKASLKGLRYIDAARHALQNAQRVLARSLGADDYIPD